MSLSGIWSKDWDEDCRKWGLGLLRGDRAHWCPDWDYLPIDDTMAEALCCNCYDDAPDERTAEESIAISRMTFD